MFSGIFKSVVIAVLLGATGCSNQVPNGASAKVNDPVESQTPLPSTVKSLITIEGGKAIETILSNRQSSETEVRFAVTTDVEIEGQTEFVVAMYVRDLGDDRALAGYRLEDASGKTLWTSEYAANTTDMSWIEVSRTDGERDWSLTVETESGIVRQTHSMDDTRLVIESSPTNSGNDKLSVESQESIRQLTGFYAEREHFINRQSEDFVMSVLTDEKLLQWVGGKPSSEIDPEGPQLVNGWGRLVCDIIKAFYNAFCHKGAYDTQALCNILGVINSICDVLKTANVI